MIVEAAAIAHGVDYCPAVEYPPFAYFYFSYVLVLLRCAIFSQALIADQTVTVFLAVLETIGLVEIGHQRVALFEAGEDCVAF